MCPFRSLSCAEGLPAFLAGLLGGTPLPHNVEPLQLLCPLWPDTLGQELLVGFLSWLCFIDKMIKGSSLKVRKIKFK